MRTIDTDGYLDLKNNGELEVVFIGAGTSFTTTLYNNNIIIIKGDVHILVDFGFNAPQSLLVNTGLKPTDIEVFLPTHSHSDHIGGVEYLLLLNRYLGRIALDKPKLKLIATPGYIDVFWNNSLKGGLEWNEYIEQRKLNIKDYFELVIPKEVPNEKRETYVIDYKGIKLEIFKTNHIPNSAHGHDDAYFSYGLLIDDRALFTGDTKFDLDLLKDKADNVEVIFHDCSFEFNPVHCSIHELKTLPKKWKKKMYLMHYSDDWKNYDVSEFAGLAVEGKRYIFDKIKEKAITA